MKKIAKILSVVLCLALVMSFAVAVSAVDDFGITEGFVASELGYENGTAVENWVGEVITIAYSDGGNSFGNCAKYYNTGSAIRVYSQNTVTISAAEGYEIVSVTITTDSSKPMNADNTALTNASATYDNAATVLVPEYGTEAMVMQYTPTSGHWRIQAISVEYVGGMIEDVVPPAGPVDCQIPGDLSYTFATDEAASTGVMLRWVANADGEVSVPRMGDNYTASIMINNDYGEFGNNGYIVKSGDIVDVIVYGYGAGTVTVPASFVADGSQAGGEAGTESNPEVLTSLSAGAEKTLASGEYYYQYTARKAGTLVINTIGDGTHNMEVIINGNASVIYSNWDNDGEYISVEVAEGDVLTMKVYFDWPGAGTISFSSEFDAGEVIEPTPTPNPGTGDAIFAVLSVLAVSGLGLTAVASKKH